MTFADPARPELGLFFDGRVAEDFKLNSGTWVNVGTLRVAGIAALAPLAQDIVVTGHGGDEVRFLVFPNIAACRAHAGLPDNADVNDVISHDKVRSAIALGLAKLKAQERQLVGPRHARAAVGRACSVDGGEITDKGYINQRAVLTRRAGAVATLDDVRRPNGSVAPAENRFAPRENSRPVRLDQPHQHLKKGCLLGLAERGKRMCIEALAEPAGLVGTPLARRAEAEFDGPLVPRGPLALENAGLLHPRQDLHQGWAVASSARRQARFASPSCCRGP